MDRNDQAAFAAALNNLRTHFHATIDEAIDETIRLFSPADVAAELQHSLTSLEARLNAALTGEDQYKIGTEIHGKLRRAKAELDALPESAATAGLREQLRVLTDRLLTEVFSYTDTPGDTLASGN